MNRGLLVTIGLASLAASSFADITFDGAYAVQSVKITYSGGNTWNNENVTAGKLKFKDPTNGTGLGTEFLTVCVDLDHYLNYNGFSVDTFNTLGMGNGLEMAGKICRAFFAAAGASAANCAALQVAVWEAMYDGVGNAGTPDFGAGNFKCSTAAAVTQATVYYAAANNSWGNSLYLKPVPQGSNGQGQITPVPEPGTVVSLVIGGLCLLRKRNRSKDRVGRRLRL